MHPNHDKLLELTAQIVAAELRALGTSGTNPEYRIPAIYAVLAAVGQDVEPQQAEPLKPAVPVKKSVTPDAIISLEDGSSHTLLKPHLTTLGMTPDEYRAKWGLPDSYPMVAPNYAARRSEIAKERGLGRKRA